MSGLGVLFVCTGNLHRSPIAERLLVARLGQSSAGFRIAGAGTQAWPGSGLDGATARVIEELGGDPAGFATRRLTAELVEDAGLVLGLAREHREAAVRLYPPAMRRCFVLEEFARLADCDGGRPADVVSRAAGRRGSVPRISPDAEDVEDPHGQPEDVLRSCAERIDAAVRRVATALAACVDATPSR